MPLSVIGRSMTWGEAIRLTQILVRDWSSWLAASIGGWAYPMPREAIILADLFDLQHASKSRRRPKQYPRPWNQDRVKRFGKTALTREGLRAIIDAHRDSTKGGTDG